MEDSMTQARPLDATPAPHAPAPEELIARAEALIPEVRADAAAADARGRFSDELLERFRDAGFYRMYLPRMFGGYEVSNETFLEVVHRIAAGSAGSAWCLALSASHVAVVASALGEEAQRELIEPHGELRAPHRNHVGGRAERAEGGFLISGRWRYCSGAPVSTHFMANTRYTPEDGGEPVDFTFVTAIENVAVLDDWGGGVGLGVQASGSNTVEIAEPLFVPERHCIFTDFYRGSDIDWAEGSIGARLHGNGHYVGVFAAVYNLCFGAIFSGAARGAVETLAEMARTTQATFAPPGVRMQENPDVQRALGRAAALADAAHATMVAAARMNDALFDRWELTRAPIAEAETMRVWALSRQAAQLGCEAVQLCFQHAGPGATARDHPLQRFLRDCQMYLGHGSNQPIIDLARGQGQLGLPIRTGFHDR